MAQSWAHTFGRRALRLGGIAVLVGGILVVGLLGWQWRANATVGHLTVTGTQHASPDTLRRLARVDSGAVMSDLDRARVADRVERHPWVQRAEVTAQWMRRTLAITVTERTPAALAVTERGRPAYYLDRSGHAMPLPDSAGYDVPLVRGLSADFHPVRTVAPPSLQKVFAALPKTDTEALVAEIELQPDSSIQLITTPVGEHGAIPVRLGTAPPMKKLRTLRAFAQQVLVQSRHQGQRESSRAQDANAGSSTSNAPIELIDLRFDGQVVTRERPPG